jgi:uncharacterized protein (TIGR00369 family)
MPPTSHRPPLALRLDAAELSSFLDSAFPAVARTALGEVARVELNHVRLRLEPGPETLRPGDIVSGPTLMGLVDVAAYGVVLAHIGPAPMAVTATLNISFLRACRPEQITADARLLKLGRRLATVDVRLWQRSEEAVVAQATVGYALPDTL